MANTNNIKTSDGCVIEYAKENAVNCKKETVATVSFTSEHCYFIDISYSNEVDWDKIQWEVLTKRLHFVIIRCGVTYFGKYASLKTYSSIYYKKDKNGELVEQKGVFIDEKKSVVKAFGQAEDALFASSVEECEKRGIPFGLYYFSAAVTKEEAEKEAALAIACYKKAQQKTMLMPLIFLDVEKSTSDTYVKRESFYRTKDKSAVEERGLLYKQSTKEKPLTDEEKKGFDRYGRADPLNLSSAQRKTNIYAFYTKIHNELPEVKVGLYTFSGYLKNILYAEGEYSDFLIWIAHHGEVNRGVMEYDTWNKMSEKIKRVDFWQYTSKGNIKRISNYGHDVLKVNEKIDLDANVCFAKPEKIGLKGTFYLILNNIMQSCETNPNQNICRMMDQSEEKECLIAVYAYLQKLQEM